jgi:hypothetical protein
MSNFITFGQMSDGIQGTAPSHYVASTADNLATITAVGYLNDKAHIVKNNDYIWINYSDTTVLPANVTATPGQFQVVFSTPNTSLVLLPSAAQVGSAQRANVTITFSQLATAGHAQIFAGVAGAQYQVLNMFLNSGGTNFSGSGANRNLSITDGTTVYSVIPAATLQALTNSAWGSTALPFPASAAIDTFTAVGQPLYGVYSGGTTDYTAGSLVLTISYTRTV